MIEHPVVKPTFHVEIVEPEGVFLLSEQGHFVLKGELYCAIAPLLDGLHTSDEIVDALMGKVSAAEVYYALGAMESKGYVVEATPQIADASAAFWYASGVDPVSADERLRKTPVSLVAAGGVALAPFAEALGAMGLRVEGRGELTIVVTDDYLQEDLAEINAAALVSGKPWLLVKPVGALIWIGPVFRPGVCACWECLARRLRANRDVESYLLGGRQRQAPFPISCAATPASLQVAVQLAALEAAKAIGRGYPHPNPLPEGEGVPSSPSPEGKGPAEMPADATLITFDTLTLETQRHTIVRLPQCRACGCPSPAATLRRPPALGRRMKPLLAAGSHRTRTAEQILAQYERHVSPITGAVSALNRLHTEDERLLHAWGAGFRSGLQSIEGYAPNSAPRGGGGGKGASVVEARASALCEALETYSSSFHGDEPRTRASYRELGARAIHPAACTLFSAAQYMRQFELNARQPEFSWIPARLDEETPIDWTPVWSLTRQEFRYVPTEYCYHRAPLAGGVRYCPSDANGHAVGASLEEAVRHGLLELIERDSVTIWWYNRLRRPALDLDSFDEPYVVAVRQHYRENGRELWVLDLTTDLGVPVFAAVVGQTGGHVMLGFGAELDPRVALLRAVTELNQLDAMIGTEIGGGGQEHGPADPATNPLDWWSTAGLVAYPYLGPDSAAPARRRAGFAELWSDDVYDDVNWCQRALEAQGLEVLVLDQTRNEIGLPAVQVIVPGLRHFRPPRLAAGRLYDVPVRLGWLETPLREDELNQVPLML